MPATAFIEFQSVSKRYGDGPLILDDVNLTIQRGDFVAIIGASGCGKSTLLRLVCGLSPLSSGALSIDGSTPERARERTGFIFQEATLLPWLTVTENIELLLKLRGVPAKDRLQRAAQLRKLVALDHVANHYPRQLSGGMKMRVSIARALARQPEVLLLDEPFAALDDLTRHRLNDELLALREATPFTALFVTHNVEEAVFLANKIVVLAPNPGRVHRVLDVPFSYPRNPALRTQDAFHHCVDRAAAALAEVALHQAA